MTEETKPLTTTDGVTEQDKGRCAPAPGSATDVAHQWLKKQREDWHGHISIWTPQIKDQYHRDLGLLVDFVTDCWPNSEVSSGAKNP